MPHFEEEPDLETADSATLFTAYLDYYRSAVVRKVHGLSDDQLQATMLPSGWSPAELINHLLHMERRWFLWGFLAEPIAEPWGDHEGGDPHGRWVLPAGVSVQSLIESLSEMGDRTGQILGSADLGDHARTGGRFTDNPPTLAWICFHVLQEYARHAGHLDSARELIDGSTGE